MRFLRSKLLVADLSSWRVNSRNSGCRSDEYDSSDLAGWMKPGCDTDNGSSFGNDSVGLDRLGYTWGSDSIPLRSPGALFFGRLMIPKQFMIHKLGCPFIRLSVSNPSPLSNLRLTPPAPISEANFLQCNS